MNSERTDPRPARAPYRFVSVFRGKHVEELREVSSDEEEFDIRPRTLWPDLNEDEDTSTTPGFDAVADNYDISPFNDNDPSRATLWLDKATATSSRIPHTFNASVQDITVTAEAASTRVHKPQPNNTQQATSSRSRTWSNNTENENRTPLNHQPGTQHTNTRRSSRLRAQKEAVSENPSTPAAKQHQSQRSNYTRKTRSSRSRTSSSEPARTTRSRNGSEEEVADIYHEEDQQQLYSGSNQESQDDRDNTPPSRRLDSATGGSWQPHSGHDLEEIFNDEDQDKENQPVSYETENKFSPLAEHNDEDDEEEEKKHALAGQGQEHQQFLELDCVPETPLSPPQPPGAHLELHQAKHPSQTYGSTTPPHQILQYDQEALNSHEIDRGYRSETVVKTLNNDIDSGDDHGELSNVSIPHHVRERLQDDHRSQSGSASSSRASSRSSSPVVAKELRNPFLDTLEDEQGGCVSGSRIKDPLLEMQERENRRLESRQRLGYILRGHKFPISPSIYEQPTPTATFGPRMLWPKRRSSLSGDEPLLTDKHRKSSHQRQHQHQPQSEQYQQMQQQLAQRRERQRERERQYQEEHHHEPSHDQHHDAAHWHEQFVVPFPQQDGVHLQGSVFDRTYNTDTPTAMGTDIRKPVIRPSSLLRSPSFSPSPSPPPPQYLAFGSKPQWTKPFVFHGPTPIQAPAMAPSGPAAAVGAAPIQFVPRFSGFGGHDAGLGSSVYGSGDGQPNPNFSNSTTCPFPNGRDHDDEDPYSQENAMALKIKPNPPKSIVPAKRLRESDREDGEAEAEGETELDETNVFKCQNRGEEGHECAFVAWPSLFDRCWGTRKHVVGLYVWYAEERVRGRGEDGEVDYDQRVDKLRVTKRRARV